MKAFSQGNADFSVYGNIIEDIRHQAKGVRFPNFCHAKRNCNIVADALAKKGKGLYGA